MHGIRGDRRGAARAERPAARIVGTDRDPRAVACALANGVEAYRGDLFTEVPEALRGKIDVVVAVVPYVPTPALDVLPSDTLRFEDASHYDGGPDGTDVLRRVVEKRPGSSVPAARCSSSSAGTRPTSCTPSWNGLGYRSVETWSDEEGDVRGLEAILR